ESPLAVSKGRPWFDPGHQHHQGKRCWHRNQQTDQQTNHQENCPAYRSWHQSCGDLSKHSGGKRSDQVTRRL
ncbi:MAG: hypothetical protein ACK4YM_11415, partial [Novosphingobium sp.]